MLDLMGRPQMLLVDIWPLGDPLLIVSSHEVAEQLSKSSDLFPWACPKWPGLDAGLRRLIGGKSLLSSNGEEWRILRKKYNAAFSHQQLLTYLPAMVDKVAMFLEILNRHVMTGDDFPLLEPCADLAFDVIARVATGLDVNAQSSAPSQFTREYMELMASYDGILALVPGWMVPFIDNKRRRLEKSIHNVLSEHVRDRFVQEQEVPLHLGHSILSHRLQSISSLTTETMNETCDQIKTFLLAGRDTTGITLAWTIYELSRTPGALHAVRVEADAAIGPEIDISSVRDRLATDRHDLLGRMPYTQAVIRETLRLHPPGGAMRYSKKNTGLYVREASTGQSHCVDGLAIYVCEHLIHRDPAVYGDSANYFLPERWLDDDVAAKVPVSAWRPFERGPRGCIGQELAIMEVCLAVALACRLYDFEKVGLGASVVDEKGRPVLDTRTNQFQVKEELHKVGNSE